MLSERVRQIDKVDQAGWLRILLMIILLPIRPFMVLLAWIFGGNRPKEKQDITILRIEERSGDIREAHYVGGLRAATFARGDEVSLWGENHKGVLLIRSGFNHTNGAEIL